MAADENQIKAICSAIASGESLDVAALCAMYNLDWFTDVRPIVEEYDSVRALFLQALSTLRFKLINGAFRNARDGKTGVGRGKNVGQSSADLASLKFILAMIDDGSILGLNDSKRSKSNEIALRAFLEGLNGGQQNNNTKKDEDSNQ